MSASSVKKVKSSGRSGPRRNINPITVSSMSSLENLSKICRGGEIVDASISGFLLIVKREDLVPAHLRKNLNIDSIVGTRVFLHLPQLDIEISGRISRTKLMGKKGYAVGIDFSEDAPEYWRECLLDLLPRPGEID
jgi:hypothetical protein